jgi:hypothetical protein
MTVHDHRGSARRLESRDGTCELSHEGIRPVHRHLLSEQKLGIKLRILDKLSLLLLRSLSELGSPTTLSLLRGLSELSSLTALRTTLSSSSRTSGSWRVETSVSSHPHRGKPVHVQSRVA